MPPLSRCISYLVPVRLVTPVCTQYFLIRSRSPQPRCSYPVLNTHRLRFCASATVPLNYAVQNRRRAGRSNLDRVVWRPVHRCPETMMSMTAVLAAFASVMCPCIVALGDNVQLGLFRRPTVTVAQAAAMSMPNATTT